MVDVATQPVTATEPAEPRRRGFARLVTRDYVLVLVAALLLASLVFVADRRANDASNIRKLSTFAAQKRERLTEEVLRDAYGTRPLAALQNATSNAHQLAILKELLTATPANAQTLLELSAVDASQIYVDHVIGAPVQQTGYNLSRYIDAANAGSANVLAQTGTPKLATAAADDTVALQLRVLAILPAVAIFTAGLVALTRRRARPYLMAAGWLLVAACAGLWLAVEL